MRNAVSFDHLTGAGKQRRRDDEAKCLGSRKVDELELGRLLDGQVDRLNAGKDFSSHRLRRDRANVADGSETEIAVLRRDVCFAPVSGHRQAVSACPKSASNGSGPSLLLDLGQMSKAPVARSEHHLG